MRSGRLVAWTRSWQAGLVSYDEVLDHTRAADGAHRVAGAIGDVALGRFLVEIRGDTPTLVLPVPGDPRGLPEPGPFTGHALTAGEAVLAGSWGLVPEVRPAGHGDAGDAGGAGGAGGATTVVWHSYAVAGLAPQQVAVAEAESELTEAVREAASALTRLDVARWRPDLAGAFAALRRPAPDGALPPGCPARAHRLLALADRVGGILRLAAADAPGAAVTAQEAVLRDDLLRSVAPAVRQARLAAYNARIPPPGPAHPPLP
jgi:hypothetical protein